nr:proline-rich receptor-like protein kinase PERK2 [Lolium perenne]
MSGARIFDRARTLLLAAWMVCFDKLDVAKAVLPDNGRMVVFQAKQARLSLPLELQIVATNLPPRAQPTSRPARLPPPAHASASHHLPRAPAAAATPLPRAPGDRRHTTCRVPRRPPPPPPAAAPDDRRPPPPAAPPPATAAPHHCRTARRPPPPPPVAPPGDRRPTTAQRAGFRRPVTAARMTSTAPHLPRARPPPSPPIVGGATVAQGVYLPPLLPPPPAAPQPDRDPSRHRIHHSPLQPEPTLHAADLANSRRPPTSSKPQPRSGPVSPDLARTPASALRRRVTQTLPSSRRRTSTHRGLSLAELLLAAASSTGRARLPPEGASSPLRPSSPQQASPDSSLPPRDSSLHSSPIGPVDPDQARSDSSLSPRQRRQESSARTEDTGATASARQGSSLAETLRAAASQSRLASASGEADAPRLRLPSAAYLAGSRLSAMRHQPSRPPAPRRKAHEASRRRSRSPTTPPMESHLRTSGPAGARPPHLPSSTTRRGRHRRPWRRQRPEEEIRRLLGFGVGGASGAARAWRPGRRI